MSRNAAIDGCKLALALCVVALHADIALDISPLLHHVLVQGLFRIAVPVFFIFSGYYFYRACQRNAVTWIKRVGILYLVWTVLYAGLAFTDVSWKTITLRVVAGYFHLWYIAGLLQGGIILYFLRHIADCWLAVLATLLCVSGALLMYALRYSMLPDSLMAVLGTPSLHIIAYRNGLMFGFPMMAAGWLIYKRGLANRCSRRTLAVAAVLSLCAVLVESLWHYGQVQRGHASGSFDMMLSVMVASPFIAMLAITSTRTHGEYWRTHLPTAVYLVHPMILFALADLADLEPTAAACITMAGAVLASFGIIRLHRRYPIFL